MLSFELIYTPILLSFELIYTTILLCFKSIYNNTVVYINSRVLLPIFRACKIHVQISIMHFMFFINLNRGLIMLCVYC